jgi:RNA polymerase sigma-70 factor (ECF subfamily)
MNEKVEKAWVEFNDQLRRFIFKRIPDEDIAEDILQEVFVKIHSNIETLKDEGKFQSWIYQITRNAITDYFRGQKTLSELPETPNTSKDSEEVVQKLIPCIKAMVDSLPDRYRQALVLTEYEELTQKEMAEKLGISLSGAKSRVQRGREKLKEMLLECCHFEFDRFGKVLDYQPLTLSESNANRTLERHHKESKVICSSQAADCSTTSVACDDISFNGKEVSDTNPVQ